MRVLSSFKMAVLFILAFTFSLTCQKKQSPQKESQDNCSHFVVAATTVLKEAPGKEYLSLDTIPLHDSLCYLFREAPSFGNHSFFPFPWVYVRHKQDSGWVLSKDLFPDSVLVPKNKLLRYAAIRSIVGNDVLKAINQVDTLVTKQGISLDSSLSVVMELKNQINKALAAWANKFTSRPPEMFWLGDSIPGLFVQFDPSLSNYQCMLDYGLLLNQERADDEDRLFGRLLFSIFPTDSLEHSHPSWTLAPSPFEQYSLLGRGIHQGVILAAQDNFFSKPFYRQQAQYWKSAVLNDIMGDNTVYWEGAEEIIREIDQILGLKDGILSKTEIISLTHRKKMFLHPETHKLVLNYKSGLYE